MPEPRPSKTDLPENLVKVMERVWPDGVVNLLTETGESYFWDVLPKLRRDLSRITGASITFERQAEANPRWEAESNPDEDPPDWIEPPHSYHLFFLVPAGEVHSFDIDSEQPYKDGELHWTKGRCSFGCAVGVSLLAPFAAIRKDVLERYEDNSFADPDVEPHVFPMGEERPGLDGHIVDLIEEEGLEVLDDLRGKIAHVLESHGIEVLPERVLKKPVPWLERDEDVSVGFLNEAVTVEHALFVKGVS